MFLSSSPGYSALVDEYAWEKTFAAEKKKRARSWLGAFDQATRFRTIVGKKQDRERIERFIRPNASVLEIGCGGSNNIPERAVPYGIEISKALAERSNERFAARGGHVIHAPAIDGLDEFPAGFFDAILMRSYLEHEENPGPVLDKARKVLRDDGVVYVRVPNYGSANRHVMGRRWCGFRFPDHLNYFTARTLARMAAAHGFSAKMLNRLSIFDDNIIAVLRPLG